eukprot:m.94806 g.94806  ORF g.94806 m.94806 type:complete len:133 (-) comp13875_c0_seq1:46-444(-)
MAASMACLCSLAFLATGGILMLILACALPQYNDWRPLSLLAVYVLVPLPFMFARRASVTAFSSSTEGVGFDIAFFVTSALVVSGYALPLILYHSAKIVLGACLLSMGGTSLIFLTILLYSRYNGEDDGWGTI